MTEEEILLKALLEAPDDDAPRLAYAQWFDDRGTPPPDPRGAFIRVQIERVVLGQGGDQSVRNDLAYREEKLMTAYRAAWAGSIGPLVDAYEFDRGFIELVTLSAGDFLARAPVLFAAAPIRHLNLTDVAPVAEELFASSHLGAIRSLQMDNGGLSDAHLTMLATSPTITSLKWLSVAYNQLGFDGANALAASPTTRDLIYVNFHGNPLDPVAQFGFDDANIVGEWLPPEAEKLEAEHGYVPWLHRTAETVWDLVPDRFRVGV